MTTSVRLMIDNATEEAVALAEFLSARKQAADGATDGKGPEHIRPIYLSAALALLSVPIAYRSSGGDISDGWSSRR